MRDAGALGSLCAHDILVDGNKAVAIRAGEFQALYLAPGPHTFVVQYEGGLCPAFSQSHSTVLRDGTEEVDRIFKPSGGSQFIVELVSKRGTALEDAPGTLADTPLRRDIRSHLEKLGRESHDERCAFDVVRAEPYELDELSKVGKTSPEAERLERKLRREGNVHVERWTVDWCGSRQDYEVLLHLSPGGGTDISASPIEPAHSTETGLDEGLAAHRRGAYQAAFRQLLPLAEQGVAEAQFVVGVMYNNGQGVAEDPSEAAKWLRRAAEQGLPDAQHSVGNMYFMGQQVQEDPMEAVKWYRRAAEQGHAEAQFSLASMYSVGDGVGRDYVLSYMWCTVSDAGSGVRRCDRIVDKMTREQVVKAKALASEFVPRKERAAHRSSETVR